MAKIHIVCGPTASGKSAIALSLAEKSGGVIINADSQQVYADLRILTARPSAEEDAIVPHRLYGFLPAHEPCSAGKWLRLAKMEIDWALGAGKAPIVCGGTGLYLKALMEGIAEIPDIDPSIRQQSASDYEAMGKDAFAERLREIDPEFFARLKVYDKQRLVRAWEVWLATAKPLSHWQAEGAKPPYPSERFEITKVELPRDELYRRCDARFIKMVEQGAVDEVKRMWGCGDAEMWRKAVDKSPYPHIPTSPHPLCRIIGVPELSAHLRGEMSLDEAVAKAQQATRNYAKRQITWFRRQF